MTKEERERIDELADWVGALRQALNNLTAHKGLLAKGPLIVSQARWDRLFQAEENLRAAALAVSEELDEAARKAGVPGV